ncbi:DUF1217 domain-containing protein [Aliiroseovarius sediminis]|uniref:DUF1217 domain-containing protein n=1 Tax=Aliiroseovarius sediminis TaxID=2925839 RepID=UPI001F59320F|nr:DUF1217 domain-containing protein [Aliiroseovarius sediminis]MCI2394746.1 DUF1217 domain-containing protein [Aliiroseovarius sediminis]
MTYQPIVPMGGAAGWAFLQRTQAAQQKAFDASPQIQRDTQYFESNIGEVKTSSDLVGDRRLLRVALGAYGLDDDLNSTYFINKVLDDGTLDPADLANKLSDKRYLEFAKDFGFGDYNIPRTQMSDFAADITAAYRTKQFEIAVGQQDPTMRLAMTLDNQLSDIVRGSGSDDTKWYKIMGNPPLREVFQTAFGLPTAFGSIDIDQQLSMLRDKADRYFGDTSVDQFTDQGKRDELNRLFLVRSQIAAGTASMSSGSIALNLLQQIQY